MNYSFEDNVTATKAVSIDLLRYEDWTEYFEFRIKWSRKEDHAGAEMAITIFGLSFRCSVFDMRHWNDEADRWALPDDVYNDDEYNDENEAIS